MGVLTFDNVRPTKFELDRILAHCRRHNVTFTLTFNEDGSGSFSCTIPRFMWERLKISLKWAKEQDLVYTLQHLLDLRQHVMDRAKEERGDDSV